MTERKRILVIFGLVFALFLLAVGAFLLKIDSSKDVALEESGVEQVLDEGESVDRFGGVVTNVIDGDTIDVLLSDGKRERVRLVGIDTPEIYWETMTADCYGFEAKEFLTEHIKGREVYLEKDERQPERDKYDRLLAYVILPAEDGSEENINLTLVEMGFAREFTVGNSYSYRSFFIEAEERARNNDVGLWEMCAI